MNAETYRAQKEALEKQDEIEQALLMLSGYEWLVDSLYRGFAAARRDLSRWELCPKCGGDGDLVVGDGCVRCGGLGVIPNQERLGAAQEVAMNAPQGRMAEAAIRAFDQTGEPE